MNRAFPLLALVALAGGGLGYFALQTNHRGPRTAPATDGVVETGTRTPTATATEDTSKDLSLAAIAIDRGEVRASESGPAKVWEIIPMNSVGQLLADARITATRASQERTASGRTKWQLLPAGAWDLVIESEGNPTWRREVVLVAGKSTRTSARLGEEVRVQGQVIDTNGDPIVRMQVFLLPAGVRHPERSEMKQDRSAPREPARAQNGAVTAKLDGNGRFTAKLPKAGQWRVSVGAPSKARWTQSRASELTYGGPDHVTATIPAKAGLRVTFSGSEEERPSQLSAYRYDAKMAILVDQGRQERFIDQGMTMEEAQRKAKQSAMSDDARGKGDGGKREARSGTARSTKKEMRAALEKGNYATGAETRGVGQQIFEPGWRMVKTARLDESGSAVFTDMPGSVDLKFLFVRGRERIITAGSYRLTKGRANVGVASLPPLGNSPTDRADTRATLSITLSDETAGEPRRKPGVAWSH